CDASAVIEVQPDFRGFPMDSISGTALRRRLLAAAQAIPGVESAARVNSMLFGTNTADLRVPGVDSVPRLGRFNFQVTSPGYFAVMRTRIVRGRGFTDFDREATPRVAVVSSAMARVLWPGKDALGQCMYVDFNSAGAKAISRTCTTVVGIAEDAAQQSILDDQRFMYYLPVEQLGWSWAATIL